MHDIEFTFEVTLELDEEWASNQTADELIEYIKDRIHNSLGFRGQIKRLRAVGPKRTST